MEKKELDKVIKSIRSRCATYEECEEAFCAIGVEFKLEPVHTHVKTFVKSANRKITSIIGFYNLTSEDMEYIKGILEKDYFYRGNISGYTFLKLHG